MTIHLAIPPMSAEQYFEGVSFHQDIRTRQQNQVLDTKLLTYRSFNPDLEEVTFEQDVIFLHQCGAASIRCYYDGQEQRGTIVPQDICLVVAGQTFGSAPEDRKEDHGLSSSALFLEPRAIRQFVERTLDREPSSASLRPLFLEHDPYVTETANVLRSLAPVATQTDQLYADTLLQALYAHLVYHYTSHHSNDTFTATDTPLSAQRFKIVEDYVRAYYHRNISLQELADLVHLSPYYFARQFKKTTGMSPHNYLLHVRIERAKGLLEQDEANLYKIAVELGFADQSHFTRHFRKVTGATPRQYHLLVKGR